MFTIFKITYKFDEYNRFDLYILIYKDERSYEPDEWSDFMDERHVPVASSSRHMYGKLAVRQQITNSRGFEQGGRWPQVL